MLFQTRILKLNQIFLNIFRLHQVLLQVAEPNTFETVLGPIEKTVSFLHLLIAEKVRPHWSTLVKSHP